MDDVAVLLEHVDLLDGLDGLNVHLLEGGLQLLVIGAGVAGHLLDLAAGSALASVGKVSVEFVRRGRKCVGVGFVVGWKSRASLELSGM